MSFLTKSLRTIAQQQLRINSLTNGVRALSVTPPLHRHKPKFVLPKPATTPEIPVVREVPITVSPTDQLECQKVFNQVNEQVAAGEEGRLFAVVHLCGKQFKITAGDIILVEGYWPPTIGDEIRLEKVLLAGGRDFTLIGRPLLAPGVVDIKATIIEKTLTHTKTHFKKKRRKQYVRINFQRSPNTMIRINTIEVAHKVDVPVEGVNEKRVF